MFNFLINFCIVTFVCYAAAGPVKAILFPKKRPSRRPSRGQSAFRELEDLSSAYATAGHSKAAAARKAKIIRINSKKKARRKLRAA